MEWGVAKVRAPEVWAAGFNGQGVVVGGQDTGYDWNHPAIKGKYRGWNGVTADHNFNWHDAIHSGGGSCGARLAAALRRHRPRHSHHGDRWWETTARATRSGVAPGAKWIGCRNMDQGSGTPATYSECFQWFLRPAATDLDADSRDWSPDVINNSWSCPPQRRLHGSQRAEDRGREHPRSRHRGSGLRQQLSGSGCSSVSDPPAIYQASFSVGATSNTATDTIAGFSSRGPVTIDGSNRLKPNVSAPGVGVRSSVPGGGCELQRHRAWLAPMSWVRSPPFSAHPSIVGQVDTVEATLSGHGGAPVPPPRPAAGFRAPRSRTTRTATVGSTPTPPPSRTRAISACRTRRPGLPLS